MNWEEANAFIIRLNKEKYCGYPDWRLPTIKELYSLIDYAQYNSALPQGHPFSNVQPVWYWSSTAYAYYMGYAWAVSMYDGDIDSSYCKSDGSLYVWPVRTASLPHTTKDNRFTDHSDSTVTDNQTGLMWTKNANEKLVKKVKDNAIHGE